MKASPLFAPDTRCRCFRSPIGLTSLLGIIALTHSLVLLGGCDGPQGEWVYREQPASQPAKSPADEAAALIAKAAEKRQGRKFTEARDLLQKAVRFDPSNGRAHHELGLIYYQLGDLYNAATQLDIAAKLMPDRPEPYFNLAQVLETGGKYDQAIAEYGRALKLKPDDPAIQTNLIRTRVKAGLDDKETLSLIDRCMASEQREEWTVWLQRQQSRIRRKLQTAELSTSAPTAQDDRQFFNPTSKPSAKTREGFP